MVNYSKNYNPKNNEPLKNKAFAGLKKLKKEIRDQEIFEGTVKWFDADKGYGFIRHGKYELFVHFTNIADDPKILKEKDKVNFVIAESNKGKKAIKVSKIS